MNPRRRDESAWLAFLRELWGPYGLAPGHGDDCAALPPRPFAITTDFLAEGADFERGWGPWEALGYKALAVNLSDLAAAGATPRYFLLTLALPGDLPDAAVEGLLRGLHALSEREGCQLAGGDLSGSRSGLCLSIAALGDLAHPMLLRSGGAPGDRLYVSGHLGGPRAALARFRRGEKLGAFDPSAGAPDPASDLLDRFFRPPSQGALGAFLSATGAASACLDLSDGLAADLPRLCAASGCGARLDGHGLPVQPGVGGDPLAEALSGGEEQVLLFAVPPHKVPLLDAAPAALYPVGELVAGRDLSIVLSGRERPLAEKGFDHFAP